MTEKRRWTAAGAALLWCAALLVAHAYAGTVACGWLEDNNRCAGHRAKDAIYRGVLVDDQGRPLTGAFTVSFPSRDEPVGGFSTDADGRFCIRWGSDGIAYAHIGGTTVVPQFPNERSGPPPSDCQEGDAGVPWNRAKDLTRSPQYLSLWFVALLAAVYLMAAIGRRGNPSGERPRNVGLALTGVATLLFVVLWF